MKGEGTFRLPTEAEWEWACRAGTRTRFCFGDEESGLADYGWYYGNSRITTYPVGAKKPNAWGLFDCHGNVSEWCGDRFSGRFRGWWPEVDPTGPVSGAGRVLRDGSWHDNAWACRSACRLNYDPDARRDTLGFRLVLSPSSAP
jgi:formylglycine-generating enzyme required for sulfatase activity